MTESEWLASEDPARMLEVLLSLGGTARQPPHPSDRKLRLFACAFWRWYAAHPQRDQQADLVRLLTACRLGEAVADAKTTREIAVKLGASWHAGGYLPLYRDGAGAARASAGAVKDWPPRLPGSEGMCYQAALLRDIVGNPFRRVIVYRPASKKCPRCHGTGQKWQPPAGLADSGTCNRCVWCQGTGHKTGVEKAPWLTPTALSIARVIYTDRDFAALPILADALEDAGCPAEMPCGECGGAGGDVLWVDNKSKLRPGEAVGGPYDRVPCPWICRACGGPGRVPHPLLTHLRSPGPHVRGCWALDLVLGKE
jgi:hypothetical protein